MNRALAILGAAAGTVLAGCGSTPPSPRAAIDAEPHLIRVRGGRRLPTVGDMGITE